MPVVVEVGAEEERERAFGKEGGDGGVVGGDVEPSGAPLEGRSKIAEAAAADRRFGSE